MKSSCSSVCPDSELFALDQNSRLPKSGSGAWKPDLLVGTLEPRSSLMLVSTMCRIRCDWSDWVHGKIKPEEHSPHQQSSFEVCVRVCIWEREIDVEAPADFWPLTTLLCWRFYPEAKQQLSAYHFSTAEREQEVWKVMNECAFVAGFV